MSEHNPIYMYVYIYVYIYIYIIHTYMKTSDGQNNLKTV